MLGANTLAGWLAHLEQLHPKTIELGLDRVNAVKSRLSLEFSIPVITVGGTNGKGSSCAMLEAILTSAGYKVGLYTSPHLLHYNERVRIASQAVPDDALCLAFAAVESARGEISLSYFEFGTLAALWLFRQEGVEAMILEVGLGGRLDAVNILDADCAIVTSVDLDHMDYLGDDRESIGFEKAGIFRSGKAAICVDRSPPHRLLEQAEEKQAYLLRIGQDFGVEKEDGRQWRYWSRNGWRFSLPIPRLRGDYQLDNASGCIAALESLKTRLPVSPDNIRSGLLAAHVPGRFQVLTNQVAGRPLAILDVAHNPHAARALASNLHQMATAGKKIAVFAMLADKDISGVIEAMRAEVDLWLVAPIMQPRGADAALLRDCLRHAGVMEVQVFPDIKSAWARACQIAGDGDRIAAFGSFHTVAEVMQQENGSNGQ
ncbi:MAG: bifunctional tetrahydrofolate synthase/dihydrofolate synthase [Sulfuricellaceae bacterium]|nr:bifunctional tetrahydrofolate synthase/dihydrofolate synthase [Sulfuricellaceae bacterium]